ncbi:beta-ketoacyl synthase N-terminal-like domain-containing protein [Chryseobacterium proteolyticum]|uniref:beta-ketoacyl synthase N-terminal-like domain-containing protein n=1 Tax=Chryseobacterium proteolyticum TaxID=118127 RepID=UPI0039833D3F
MQLQIPLKKNVSVLKSTNENVGGSKTAKDKIVREVSEIVAKLLKMEVSTVDQETEFGEYGFDSLLMTQFTSALNNFYDLKLMPTVFYNYPAIGIFSEFLIKEYPNLAIESKNDSRAVTPAQDSTRFDQFSGRKNRKHSSQYNSSPVKAAQKPAEEGIAIIGISGRFPGSPDINTFWERIKNNEDLITEIPEDRWSWQEYYGDPQKESRKTKAKWGGFISDIDKFDPLFFNISPKEAALMDPQQRITLEAVYHALEDAGIATSALRGTNTGTFIGVSAVDYSMLLNNGTDLTSLAQFSTGAAHSILVNRISYLLDIHGPSEPVDTACSSALIAIHRGVEHIRNGHCDMAIAGGVNAILSPELTLSFSSAGMLSEDGRCKTFDQRANGYVRGEGVGIVILKSLSKAVDDGDHIYGVIRGTAENHGGRANTLTSPNPNAQRDLLVKAYRNSDIDPRDISYIEAHGTGTALGDPIEIEGLKLTFNTLYEDKGLQQTQKAYCSIGSVKTNAGHLESAAGMAGLAKVLMAMKHKVLPGNPHLQNPNAYLQMEDTPFRLQKETTEWTSEGNKPRIAGISSFGFGGANAHIIIEEYQPSKMAHKIEGTAIIPLSAKTKEQLQQQIVNLKNYLELNPQLDIHDVAYTLQNGREKMKEKAVFIAANTKDLINLLSEKRDLNVPVCKPEENNRALISTAENWLSGVLKDWSACYPGQKPAKISLPVYPFARNRYWIPEGKKTVAVSAKEPDQELFEYSSENITIEERAEPADVKTKTAQDNSWLMAKLIQIAAATIVLPEEDFDTTTQFKDYGFDSIMGVELVNNINSELNITIKATDLYSYPNINVMTDYVLKNFSEELKAPVEVHQYAVADKIILTEKKSQTVENKTSTHSDFAAEIAIIGISGQFGTANDLNEYWKVLAEGQCLIKEIKDEKWRRDDNNVEGQKRWASCLENPDYFDPLFFKLSGSEAEMMDPMQRLFLEHSWKAIEDAGIDPDSLSSLKCGVYAGAGHSDYIAGTEGTLPSALWGNSSAILASRISYFLNLKGPAIAVNTACSSSLVAMDLGFNSLQRGDTDLVLAGGINIINSAHSHDMAVRAGMLSADGRCYTFDSRANGFVMGEGVGVVVLKRLADAERDNDRIYGVIKGSLTNQDGTTNGITAPSVVSQEELEKEVYDRFNINPETITYVEAHGTGTGLGDPIEFEALNASFRAYTNQQNFCSLGSVKTNIGHALEAAGVASVLKVLLAMKHKQLPPSINYEKPNALINFKGSPFKIQDTLTDWNTPANTKRRAAISSFGFSGTNAHMVIEEYIPQEKKEIKHSGDVLILLSAKSREQLIVQAEQLVKHIKNEPLISLYDIAYTLQVGRSAMEERLAIPAKTIEDLVDRLTDFTIGKEGHYFTGNIRHYKKEVSRSSEASAIQNALANKFWTAVGEYWVKGFPVKWNVLYQETKCNKVSLPHYPFARERYWLKSEQKIVTSSAIAHPLLHQNNSSLKNCLFSSLLNGSESFLRDHKVFGEQVLPGVAYLEMARVAGEMGAEVSIAQLREVNWLQPVKVNTEPVQLHINIETLNNEWTYKIYSGPDEKQLHGQGIMGSVSNVVPQIKNINKLRNSFISKMDKAAYYELFRSIGLDYGTTFQGVQEVWYNEESALSRIELTPEAGFTLSPGMMDGALQTCMAISLSDQSQQLMLPFSVREINIYKPLSQEIWCYVRKNSSGKQSSSYEIEMLNQQGEVLISFTELVVLTLENNNSTSSVAHEYKRQNTETSENGIGLHLYANKWQEAGVEEFNSKRTNSSIAPLVFLAGGSAVLAEKLEESLECEVKIIHENAPEETFIQILEEIQQRKPVGQMIQLVYPAGEEMDYSFLSGLLKTAVQESLVSAGKLIEVDNLSINGLNELVRILQIEQENTDAEVRYHLGRREVKKTESFKHKRQSRGKNSR